VRMCVAFGAHPLRVGDALRAGAVKIIRFVRGTPIRIWVKFGAKFRTKFFYHESKTILHSWTICS
jgi:hypothetical protein